MAAAHVGRGQNIPIWMDPRRLKGPGLGITLARCTNPSKGKKGCTDENSVEEFLIVLMPVRP